MLLKSDDEIKAEKLKEGIKSSIFELVKKREKVKNNGEFEDFGSDYLGQLLKIFHEADTKKRITIEQMIDEIKAMYGAGHLTTTSLLSWCIFLLAIHTDWQEKAREEVFGIFSSEKPNSDGIARMKIVSLIPLIPFTFGVGIVNPFIRLRGIYYYIYPYLSNLFY